MHSILLTEQTEPDRTTLSLNALQDIITDAENQRAGRTILIWIGDGWPMLESRTTCSLSGITAVQFDQGRQLRRRASRGTRHAVQHLPYRPGNNRRASTSSTTAAF